MDSENIAAYVGLDVHKETLAIATPEWLGEIRYYGTINNEALAVHRLCQKLQGPYGNILSCYEGGPCGFGLYHQLTVMNIKCRMSDKNSFNREIVVKYSAEVLPKRWLL